MTHTIDGRTITCFCGKRDLFVEQIAITLCPQCGVQFTLDGFNSMMVLYRRMETVGEGLNGYTKWKKRGVFF